MTKWRRRIRGAFGTGLTWALAWFGAGLMLLLVPNGADVPFPLLFALLGFLAGVTFSGVLGIAEGSRRFDQMSLPRFATWGGVGGLLLSLVLLVLLGADTFPVLGPIFTLAGAGCAAASLMLARRAEDRQSLEVASDVSEAELSDEEARELLGGGG